MREHLRRDGCVVLTGDEGNPEQVVVEGVITAFVPSRDGSHCVCGADCRHRICAMSPRARRSVVIDAIFCRGSLVLACAYTAEGVVGHNRYLGIDPGLSGALAIVETINGVPALIDATDMPTVEIKS